MRLLILLLRLRGSLAGATRTAAAATAPSAARRRCLLLLAVDRRGGRLLLFATLGTRRTLLAWLILLLRTLSLTLLLLRTLSVALLLPLLLALLFASGTAATFALLALRGRLAGALLELAHLLLHEAARLRVLLRAELVVTTIRTAFPPFRIRAFAA